MTQPSLPDPCTLADIAAHLGIKKPGVVMKFKRSIAPPQPVYQKSGKHLFRRDDITAWIAQEIARKQQPKRRKPRVLTVEVRSAIVAEYETAASMREVSRRLGISIPSVKKALKDAGIDMTWRVRRRRVTSRCPRCEYAGPYAEFTTTNRD